MLNKFYCMGLMTMFFLMLPVHAVDVAYRVPSTITTTVGEPTILEVYVKNMMSSTESFQVKITAAQPNDIEITNPVINTQPIKSGESVSVYSNIRTLTENPNVLTIQIYHGATLSASTTIPVYSKKLSLPEFGLVGFIQIMSLATVIYLFVGRVIRKV